MTERSKRRGYGLACGALCLLTCVCTVACCPSGVWQDNYGSVYNILTTPSEEQPGVLETTGYVDAFPDAGCGLWDIRPPQGEQYDPTKSVVFVAQNRQPNPTDACCYAFLFEGDPAGSGCLYVGGSYRNIGGKCTGQGEMYLQVVSGTGVFGCEQF